MAHSICKFPNWRELEDAETISEGYTCDLKVDDEGVRIWLARTSIEDGEPYRHTVYVEIREEDGRWRDFASYDGANPPDTLRDERDERHPLYAERWLG